MKFYFSIFLRRLPYFLVVAVLVAALGVTLSVILPAKYRAEALLLVESEQIPGDLAESTVQTGTGEQLQIIQQQLMTRANLIDLANRFGLYRDRPGLDATEIVDDLRKRIVFDVEQPRGAAVTLHVSFASGDPNQVLQVVNEVVTQILRKNVELRTGRANATLAFFQQEVERLGNELDRQSAKLLAFQTENQDSLPDSLDYRRNRLSMLQERLLQLQREQAAQNDRRARLIKLYETTGRIEAPAGVELTQEQRQLQEVQAQLDQALLVYSPQNPTVKLLQARVEALKKVVAQQVAAAGNGSDADALSPYEVQLAQIDGELSYLGDQMSQVESEIEQLRASIEATPGNAARLAEMQRENAITQGQYNVAVQRLAQAQTGERIEALSKGQRITVVEQAVLPTEPYSPNRKLLAAGGVGAGMVLGGLVVVLLELMNQAIRRPADIVSKLGITPIATLPYVRTRYETWRRRGIVAAVCCAVILGVSGGLYAVHTYYLPMDLLLERIIKKAGLGPFFEQL
ncbi:GumC family protein [Frigidibacter sp. ROC022]|uniref:GumC family protein n=1 Tax=Frigidibacter sp. ROC022 TaxID=2971796 RepID=UPI00215A2FD6|nr:lipopolysaccharide biosynthesis protein [Frigidibacter sp. ROC022]MCR8726768.1 lipopolysaccharide biosynthesis protein [Frigidibacter sp. ROC022]